MSHFYAEIKGNRGEVSRTGNKSGIDGHIRGWDIGVCIKCHFDEEKQKDVCEVFKTGGSNSSIGRLEHLATIEEE